MTKRNGETHDKRGRVTAYGLACGIAESYAVGAFSGRLERHAATSVYRVTEDGDAWRIAYSGTSLQRARRVFDLGKRRAETIARVPIAHSRKRKRHTVCKPGAAVRLHGYMAARVLVVWDHEWLGCRVADCIITARKSIGPHGYSPGQLVTVRVSEAVPRDCIYISRQSFGRLAWRSFRVEA